MNIWEWSVKRPIGVTMLTCVVLIFGVVSFLHLPIDLMPDITYPTISLSATYGNSSPVEVETLITRPIEQALAAVPGVDELTSTSTEGRSSVRVTFTWGTDLDAAANDIRDRLDRILSRLPEGVERPTLRKFDMAATPILVLGAASKLDPVQMLRLVEDQVKYRLERVPGVASIDIGGGRKREIHVNLLPDRLKALGLRPEQIIARIKQDNLNLPAGLIEAGNFEFTIRTPGEFYQVSQVGEVVVSEQAGARVRLAEVATIVDRWQRVRQVIKVNGQPGLRIAVSKQSGKNTVEVVQAVKAEVALINQELPQLNLISLMDSAKYIQRSIDNVTTSAYSGAFLAILILLLFLGELGSTLVIGTAIPLSIITTFALMYYNGFTLNIMSMGGLALGTGMLLDNSIVVLENIFRFCESGKAPKVAAIEGTAEVAAPILASTLTTIVIFLPLLFVEGMTGVMFKQLSWVVGFALACSIVVSVTLVPMLSSQFLGGVAGKGGDKTAKASLLQRVIGFVIDRYLEILTVGLHWRKTSLLLVVLLAGSSLLLVPRIGTEFMPTADEGDVRVTAEMAVGTRLSLVDQKLTELEQLLMKYIPERENIITTAGGGGFGGGGHGMNRGEFRIPLMPQAQRKRSSLRVAADLRKDLANLPGLKIRTREGAGHFMFRMGGGTDKVQVQVRGHNLDRADLLARQVEAVLKQIDGVADVQLSRESGAPERLISIDRSRAADQKLTISRIAEFLETILSGTPAGNFREGGDEYRILVQAGSSERMSLEEILDLTILNADNQPVALRNVAAIVSREGPLLIERVDQERVINVSADPGLRPVGEVLEEVRAKLHSIPLPNGFSLNLGGDYEERQKSFRELLLSFILAIILVYMVMAIQYESIIDPLIVMVTVPLSAIGVILIMVLTGTTLNVQSFIGIIMLGGIVVNNAILLVDHTNLLYRERGMRLFDALLEAGRNRFRPVLMTALTTMLGLVPLALGVGEGGEVQAPLARVVIGGLSCATLISLLFIPVVYALVYGRSASLEETHV